TKFVLTKGLIIEFDSSDDLKHKAHKLYRDFRSEESEGFRLSQFVRSFVYFCLRPFEPKIGRTREVCSIEFIGVSDTVDAYGMPVEELKTGIDRYIWPLALKDRELHPNINKACHALSIDDMRTSFHPLLWDESDYSTEFFLKHTDER